MLRSQKGELSNGKKESDDDEHETDFISNHIEHSLVNSNPLVNSSDNGKQQRDEENPFSFKSFLQTSTIPPPQPPSSLLPPLPSPPPPPPPELPELDLAPPLMFHQNDTQQELKVAYKKIEKQQKHILKLENQVKELIKKEENDNSQLEMVIQQVEQNLKETTIRAVESEKTVGKLKQDVKQLTEQLKFKTNEALLLKQQNEAYEQQLIKLAFKLTNATSHAKTTMLDLLSGVSELTNDVNKVNVFIQSMQSSDKFKDVSDAGDEEEDL